MITASAVVSGFGTPIFHVAVNRVKFGLSARIQNVHVKMSRRVHCLRNRLFVEMDETVSPGFSSSSECCGYETQIRPLCSQIREPSKSPERNKWGLDCLKDLTVIVVIVYRHETFTRALYLEPDYCIFSSRALAKPREIDRQLCHSYQSSGSFHEASSIGLRTQMFQ